MPSEVHPVCAGLPAETAAPVTRALGSVVDPCSVATGVPMSLLEMGLVEAVRLDEDGVLRVALRLTSPVCWQAAGMMAAIEAAAAGAPGVRAVACSRDDGMSWLPEEIDPAARARLRALRPLA
jgi:metal-sulfur cluster biosynthetic enzyme